MGPSGRGRCQKGLRSILRSGGLPWRVEDHPLDYGDFEGTIPKGEYGGGTVMLWDRGYWSPEPGFENVGRALEKGELKFVVQGQRLQGSWVIVRTRVDERGRASWILIKHRDEAALEAGAGDPSDEDRSVASGRTMSDITAGAGKPASPFMTLIGAPAGSIWKSNRNGGAAVGLATPPKARRSAAKSSPAVELPLFIEPQLTKPVERPGAGPGWAHEIKFDGYRMQLRTWGGAANPEIAQRSRLVGEVSRNRGGGRHPAFRHPRR